MPSHTLCKLHMIHNIHRQSQDKKHRQRAIAKGLVDYDCCMGEILVTLYYATPSTTPVTTIEA